MNEQTPTPATGEVKDAGAVVTRAPMIWVPAKLKQHKPLVSACIGILAPTGTGKSTLAGQLVTDPEYRGRVIDYYTENPTSSIEVFGPGLVASGAIYPVPVFSAEECLQELRALEKARLDGAPMPLAVFFDSVSGAGDRHMLDAWENPQQKRYLDKDGNKNTFAVYGNLGMIIKQIQILCRDHLGIDAIILGTTTPRKSGVPPQLCVDGNMVPENFTRLTNYTFYMEPRTKRYPGYKTRAEAEAAVQAAPHRSAGFVNGDPKLGEDEKSWTAVVTDRYFTTMATGEVPAKASSMLELEEKAILVDVLRKIKGTYRKEEVKR